MATPHVYFSRQMVKAKYKDPKTNEYRDYEHSRATGKDGKPLLMYCILLPSANHRKLQFPKDVNGIDVNSRKAYIQVPRDAVHDTKIAHKKVMYMDCETSTWTDRSILKLNVLETLTDIQFSRRMVKINLISQFL